MKKQVFSVLMAVVSTHGLAQQPLFGNQRIFTVPVAKFESVPGELIDSALAACKASGGGVVLLPPTLGNSATWTSGRIPLNCSIWDLRSHSFSIFTDEVDNHSGRAAGLGVFLGEDIPTTNPVGNNPVGIYTSVQMRKPGVDTWGINYVVNARVKAAAVGIEGDLGSFMPEDFHYAIDQMKFVGGSPNPASTVIRVGGAHGTHRTGFRMDGVSSVWMGNIPENVSRCLPKGVKGYGCLGTYEPWRAVLADRISSSPTPQLVRSSESINGLAGNWMWASCDSGERQEDIYPTVVTDTTLTAIFNKNHEVGAVCHWYGAIAGIDMGNSYFESTPIILGNLYGTIQYSLPHFPSIAVYDATSRPGSETLRDVLLFDHDSHVILRSLGDGVRLEDKEGNETVSVSETGDLAARGVITGHTVITKRTTPSSSQDRCTKGEIWSDERYVYACVDDNHIRRSPLETF